jgi:glycine dehydrogenase subunit 1
MALWVTVYLSLMGPEGMKQVNDLCYQRAHYLYNKLIETGKFEPVFKDAVFLKEFVLKSKAPAAEVQKKLADAGFLGALETEEGYVTFCVTEKRSYEEVDELVRVLSK